MNEIAQHELDGAARRTLSSLRKALRHPNNDIVRDAAFKRFDLAFITAWKAASIYLKENYNAEATYPAAVFRATGRAGIFSEEQVAQAFKMARDHSLTVRCYREGLATKIYSRLPAHADLLEHLLAGMEATSGGPRLPLKENT